MTTYHCVKLHSRDDDREIKNYICVKDKDSFKLRIVGTDSNDSTIYGVVLYFNGERITGKKTFKRVTSFAGYKKPDRNLAEFTFDI